MKKLIIEVGSTCTKIDEYDGELIKRLEQVTIEFKRHFLNENKLNENDIQKLIDSVNKYKNQYDETYACGTSVFRNLEGKEKQEFLERFKNETGCEFDIVDAEKENKLTVYGATRFVNQKVCVFVGGGGSTEISIYDKDIKEIANSNIGVIDVVKVFPDLSADLATSNLEEVKKYVKERLTLPKEKADILILAGGGHEYFARNSGINYEENTLYNDPAATIMMDIETRTKETIRYYKEISLDEIRSRVDDPNWWYATRAMCAFVLVIAEEIGAKYIVPTNIAMAYGLVKE